MNEELIVVRQLPVIEEKLQQAKDRIETRVSEVLSLVCNEDTYKAVKKARSELNQEYNELEIRRKEVKAEIMAPYEQFEKLYKEYAGNIYAQADAKLKARISEVENGLRQQKQDEASAYFDDYRKSLGIDEYFTFAMSGVKVTLSDSRKALKARAKDFLDRVAGDLSLIETQEHKEEILVEYKRTLNISQAVTIVSDRHRMIETERQRREQTAAAQEARSEARAKVEKIVAEDAPIAPPVVVPVSEPSDEKVYARISTAFRVTGTLDKLRALKTFLTKGGYSYEQL